jgi:hypothetical protein
MSSYHPKQWTLSGVVSRGGSFPGIHATPATPEQPEPFFPPDTSGLPGDGNYAWLSAAARSVPAETLPVDQTSDRERNSGRLIPGPWASIPLTSWSAESRRSSRPPGSG